jgi:hypothetical protein
MCRWRSRPQYQKRTSESTWIKSDHTSGADIEDGPARPQKMQDFLIRRELTPFV